MDSAGNAYVTGDTGTDDFPTTPGAFDTTFNGGAADTIVAKISPVLPTPTPVVTTVTVEPTTAARSLRTQKAEVTVRDQFGNPISGVTVTATVDAQRGIDPVVSPTSATTDKDGEAEFDFGFPFRTKGGTITFTADGKRATITQQ